MNANGYQSEALSTAIFLGNLPDLTVEDVEIIYASFGLVGEAGEIAEKMKKCLRRGERPSEVLSGTDGIKKELGDQCWYLAVLSHLLGFGFSDIMKANLDKLAGRKERGTLEGSGDNR